MLAVSLGMGLRGIFSFPIGNRRRRAGFRSDADYSSAEFFVYAAYRQESPGEVRRHTNEVLSNHDTRRTFLSKVPEQNMETRRERRLSRKRLAESQRRPVDPRATTPSQARLGFAIMAVVLVVAVGLLAAMFVNNPRYDGNSPVPVSEQRR
jgi:hypothetical protein